MYHNSPRAEVDTVKLITLSSKNLSSNSPDKCSFGVTNEAKKRQKADDDVKQ